MMLFFSFSNDNFDRVLFNIEIIILEMKQPNANKGRKEVFFVFIAQQHQGADPAQFFLPLLEQYHELGFDSLSKNKK